MRGASGRWLTGLLGIALASGVPLALWFDGDAERAVSGVERFLRGAHAVASGLLVLGTLWHMLGRMRTLAARRVVRSGGLALVSVGLAAWTGALIDQTGAGAAALARIGLNGGAVSTVAVLHVAVASVLVVLFVYLHVAGRSARTVFGSWRVPLLAGVAVLAGALLLPGVAPGAASGHPATVLVAPRGFAWPVFVGLAVAVASRLLPASAPP